MDYLGSILDNRFMPHGHCFLWTTDIFWLHLLGDIVTATAYYIIPLALGWSVWKRKHLPYPSLFILFGTFILACGTTHILGIITLWNPLYRLEGLVKAVTALASIGTAFALIPIIPKALRLRSPEELERANSALERKNQESEAGRAEFRNIVERNPEGILVLSPADRILFANPAAGVFLGRDRMDLAGMRFERPDAPGGFLEYGVDGSDGVPETRFAEVLASETHWEGGPARLIILRDVTARRRSEEALRRSQELLLQAQRMEAVGRLAGGISHDFNNILTAITGFTSLALAKIPEGSPVRGELLEVARSGERASRLTRQLLAFSRKQVLSPRDVDLNHVVEDMATMVRRVIGEDIRLETRLAKLLPAIHVDPAQLEQVIVNLAVNARDAMPGGGEIILETSQQRFQDDLIGGREEIKAGDYVLLTVSDRGMGMSPEVLDQLFEPFFTTKEPGKGTGLGLSMVYGIVKQSEGHILVYS
jgi:signal transduction histidine kinase